MPRPQKLASGGGRGRGNRATPIADLIILFFLYEDRPLCGYALKQLVKDTHLERWLPISPMTVYQSLRRLTEEAASFTKDRWLTIPQSTLPKLDPVMDAAKEIDEGGNIRVPLSAVRPSEVEPLVAQGWKVVGPSGQPTVEAAQVPLYHWRAVDRQIDRIHHIRRESRKAELRGRIESLLAKEKLSTESFDEARFHVEQSSALAPDSEVQRWMNEIKSAHAERARLQTELDDLESLDPRLEIEDTLDSMHASMRDGDVATAIIGPFAAIRRTAERLYWRTGPARYRELEQQAARVRDQSDFAIRNIKVQTERLAAKLRGMARFSGENPAARISAEMDAMRVGAGNLRDSIAEVREFARTVPTAENPRPTFVGVPKPSTSGMDRAQAKAAKDQWRAAQKAARARHRENVRAWKRESKMEHSVEVPIEALPKFLYADDRIVGGGTAQVGVESRVVRHHTRVPSATDDLPEVERVSNRGRRTSFDIQFGNVIDRALYEAGRRIDQKGVKRLEEKARQEVAVRYVARVLGISERRARSRGRRLVDDIERQVFGFDPEIMPPRRGVKVGDDRAVFVHEGRLVTRAQLRELGVPASKAKPIPELLRPDEIVTLAPAMARESRVVYRLGPEGEREVAGVTLAQGSHGVAAGHMAAERHFVLPTSRWAKARLEAATDGLRFTWKQGQDDLLIPWEMTRRSRANMAWIDAMSEETLRQIDESGAMLRTATALAEDVAKGEAAVAEAVEAAKATLAPIAAKIRAIEQGRPFRWLQSLYRTKRAVDVAFNLNTGLRVKELTRRYGFESEAMAKIAKGRAIRHVDKVKAAVLRRTGADPQDFNNALAARIGEIALSQDQRGVVSWLPDDIMPRRIASAKPAVYERLKSTDEFEELAQLVWRTHNDWLQIETGLGIHPDTTPRIAYIALGYTEGAQREYQDAMGRINAPRSRSVGGRLSTNPQFALRRTTNRMLWGPEHEELILRLAKRPESGPLDPALRHMIDTARIDPHRSYIFGGELAAHSPGDVSWEFERWRLDFLRRMAQRGEDIMTAGDRHLLGLPGGDPSVPPWMPQEFPTSPAMLNHLRDQFVARQASINDEPLFEEDILTNFFRRMGQHLEVSASARFIEEVAPLVRLIPKEQARIMARGVAARTIVVDGIEYRHVSPEIIRGMKLRFPQADDVTDLYYWPAALADDVEDMARKLSREADLVGAFRGMKVVQDVWKGTQLFASPSWWTGNMISGGLMSWLIGGSRPSRWPALAPLSVQLVNDIYRSGTSIDSKVFHLGDAVFTGRELKELLIRNGVASAGRTMMEIPNLIRTGADRTGWFARNLGGGALGRWYGKWFAFNAATDDSWRVLTALDLIEQGHSIEHAADMARKAHVDFSDFSWAEQKWGTLVWPFYRWMKGNLSLQIRHFLENPSYGAAFPKLKVALEEGMDADDRLPVEMQPRWLRDNIAVQIGANPSLRYALLKTLTPAQELFEAGQAAMGWDGFFQFVQYAVGSANPLMKVPFEIAAQRELFTGRDLGDAPGAIPWADYLMNQIGPLRRIGGTMDRVERGTTDLPAELIRLSIGGTRVYSTSPESMARMYEFTQRETTDALRSRIKSARRRGDTDEAARLSNDLVAAYRDIWTLGYVDLVPAAMRARFRQERADAIERGGT